MAQVERPGRPLRLVGELVAILMPTGCVRVVILVVLQFLLSGLLLGDFGGVFGYG